MKAMHMTAPGAAVALPLLPQHFAARMAGAVLYALASAIAMVLTAALRVADAVQASRAALGRVATIGKAAGRSLARRELRPLLGAAGLAGALGGFKMLGLGALAVAALALPGGLLLLALWVAPDVRKAVVSFQERELPAVDEDDAPVQLVAVPGEGDTIAWETDAFSFARPGDDVFARAA